jgi:hypothetical protein
MATDDYETKYMGGGEALARSKAGMPWWFHALLAMACITLVGTAIAHATLASLVTLPLLLLTWVLFMFLRVTVTAETVHVQLGLFGPRIPVTDIVEVTAEKYPVLKYGGWGIRYALDGSVAYSLPGHGGRGVRIRYKKKNGRESTAWVTSPDPDGIVAAIQEARSAKGVRVAESVRVSGEAPLPAEVDEADEVQKQARG